MEIYTKKCIGPGKINDKPNFAGELFFIGVFERIIRILDKKWNRL